MMSEGDGEDGRDNRSGDEAAQKARQSIREYGNGKRWREGGHTRLKVQTALFYADDKMLSSTNPVWFQTVFDMLKGLFDWVGLKTNL